MKRSTLVAAALLVAGLAGGCLGGASDGATGPRLGVEADILNLGGDVVVVADFAVGPHGADATHTVRIAWRQDAKGRWDAPCATAGDAYEVRVRIVGVYAEAPEVLGDWGSPAPPGSFPFQDPGELTRSGECGADLDVAVTFEIALMSATRQGFFDIAVNVDGGEAGDAIWDLWLIDGDGYPDLIWQQRVASSIFGDSRGTVAFVGNCSAASGAEDNVVHARFGGLYAERIPNPEHVYQLPAPYNRFEGPVPPYALEVWSPPLMERTVRCIENQDVFVQYDVTLARVERDDAVVRAGFAGLLCGAMWRCQPEDPSGATLELSCASDGGAEPILYLEDMMLQCEKGPATPVPPNGVGLTHESGTTTWPLAPFTAVDLPPGPCELTGRATAAPAGGFETAPGWVDGAIPAGTVYPMLTWRLDVSDADGFVCDRARLGHGGPITVTYTASDATQPTRFDHHSAPTGMTR